MDSATYAVFKMLLAVLGAFQTPATCPEILDARDDRLRRAAGKNHNSLATTGLFSTLAILD